MKRIHVIILITATLFLSSCSILTILSGAKKAGSTVGKVIAAIYEILKSKDATAFTDPSTLSLIEELSKGVSTLKQYENDPVYLENFAQGLVQGSGHLVTEENSSAMVNTLLKMEKLSAFSAPGTKSPLETLELTKELDDLFRLFRE